MGLVRPRKPPRWRIAPRRRANPPSQVASAICGFKQPSHARARGLVIVEITGIFSVIGTLKHGNQMSAFCISAASQEAASVARRRHLRCALRRAPKGAVEERIHRGAGSGASTDVLREIGAPCREIGVELDVYPRDP